MCGNFKGQFRLDWWSAKPRCLQNIRVRNEEDMWSCTYPLNNISLSKTSSRITIHFSTVSVELGLAWPWLSGHGRDGCSLERTKFRLNHWRVKAAARNNMNGVGIMRLFLIDAGMMYISLKMWWKRLQVIEGMVRKSWHFFLIDVLGMMFTSLKMWWKRAAGSWTVGKELLPDHGGNNGVRITNKYVVKAIVKNLGSARKL
jgi:hypothetical protein